MVLNKGMAGDESSGFTVVEAIVSLSVVSLLLTGFFQSYLLLESQRISVARQAIANDVAYSNLRKFTTPPGVACSVSGTSVPFTHEAVSGSSAITSQTVTAYPLDGCNGAVFTGSGVRIESKVVYDRGKEVVHASIVR